MTSRPGHSIELARRGADDGYAAVVAVGGDGTVHEVANGLLASNAAASLAVIPCGSGNDFVKQLGIPHVPEDAARIVVAGRATRIDVGRVGDRFFTNGVGVGLEARIAMEARRIRRMRGTALYAAAVFRALRDYRPLRARVTIDGREIADRPLTLVTIANGPCCGGGFWLCPAARLDDGVLDVLIADGFSRTRILALLVSVLRRTHLARPGIALQRGRVVEIASDAPLPIHADGEILPPDTRLRAELLAGRLTVMTPAITPARPAHGPRD